MKVNIIGAGLAGLSAAIALAKDNIECNLISVQASERAQSVMAEGGTNGALNTMGEDDTPENHFNDTYKAGVYIGDKEAIRGFTNAAPQILKELIDLGTPFNIKGETVQQRNFGGQKKKRTAYARSSTGKALMSTLIDEVRRYEASGLVARFSHHEFADLIFEGSEKADEKIIAPVCTGVMIRDLYSGGISCFYGPVIMACGGLNGMFPEVTTGTVGNSGNCAARLFSLGVRFSNLEMIQYHPTTMKIPGKCCLVSEAARGEGGRLFIMRGGERWYFMEEKYPELGNLMPRDVVARESYFVTHDADCEGQVYLDMHHLSKDTWQHRLPDLREEVEHYLGIDPAKDPIPVSPGIHYFMGGIDVDIDHRTNVEHLFAAGECCSQYHGANRLGGNSTMGAMYGGRVAAESAKGDLKAMSGAEEKTDNIGGGDECESGPVEADYGFILKLRDIMLPALGIVRDEQAMNEALRKVRELASAKDHNINERERLSFAEAILESAIFRKESRGAHYRSDYPETSDEYLGSTVAEFDGETHISFRKVK